MALLYDQPTVDKLLLFREGFLANMAKQLQKKMATVGGASSDNENLEDSMKKVKRCGWGRLYLCDNEKKSVR